MNMSFFRKNWYLLTPAVILVIPALIALSFSVRYGYSATESVEALQHLGSSGTRYAIDFSERDFRLVRVGMDPPGVRNIIGIPMERNIPEDTHWRYSLPASGASYYHERTLVFARDKNGMPRVTERVSRFKKL